eukprot:1188633-Amphidinium_carterae.1
MTLTNAGDGTFAPAVRIEPPLAFLGHLPGPSRGAPRKGVDLMHNKPRITYVTLLTEPKLQPQPTPRVEITKC